MKRVNKILVSTAASTASSVNVPNAADVIAAGEVVVLDKNKQLLLAGSTIADSDVIFIARATSTTFTDVNNDSRTELKYSDPIEGAKVRSFTAKPYTAASAKVATFASTGFTPVVGDEYVLRFVNKDFQSETPAQYIKEYRVFATTAVLQDLYDLFRARIVADIPSNYSAGARIAGSGTTTLILTALPIPYALGSIDLYKTVDFDVFLNHVIPSTQIPEAAGAVVTYTGNLSGSGLWQQVADYEKLEKQYEGPTNVIHFPVPSRISSWDTVASTNYDLIVIEHDRTYASPDNNYDKETKLVTVIAFPDASAAGLTALAVLNPWMASTPKQFTAVTL